MKHKLISIALIAVLLCMVLVNGIGCDGGDGTTQYTLTMSSTAGGSVTPTVGAHNYSAGTVVPLTATPGNGYLFVNWTGGGTDIANATAATTTITMNADHTITAHFALNMTYIVNVPDTNQPPTLTLNTTIAFSFCAPMAMVNVLCYWDVVMGHANAINVTAGLAANTTAEYLGYFMDTNNNGSPDRGNLPFHGGLHAGTKTKDIGNGTADFVRWDVAHPLPIIPDPMWAPALPAGKLGYNWTVTQNCTIIYASSLAIYKTEIDAGRPLVVSFDYWNPIFGMNVTDPQSGQTISVFTWNATNPGGSGFPNPYEQWTYGDIGHDVTGVGYILNWDPDGAGPLPKTDYVIVHDNWPTTPVNVAIPWANWMCLYSVIP